MTAPLTATALAHFAITHQWPPRVEHAIQLYSLPTPNGVKASIALEELELPYDAHRIEFSANDQKSPAFLSLNPNGKIPALIDPNGPDGTPIGLWESGAILIYLAEKTDKLLPSGAARAEVMQWLMWQMGGLGPMLGQIGFFTKFAGRAVQDPLPRERYIGEGARLIATLETGLGQRDWIAGGYSIADIAIGPWLWNARENYNISDVIGLDASPTLNAYYDRFMNRPAVQRGLLQPTKP